MGNREERKTGEMGRQEDWEEWEDLEGRKSGKDVALTSFSRIFPLAFFCTRQQKAGPWRDRLRELKLETPRLCRMLKGSRPFLVKVDASAAPSVFRFTA
jgi:hypothetical protein